MDATPHQVFHTLTLQQPKACMEVNCELTMGAISVVVLARGKSISSLKGQLLPKTQMSRHEARRAVDCGAREKRDLRELRVTTLEPLNVRYEHRLQIPV